MTNVIKKRKREKTLKNNPGWRLIKELNMTLSLELPSKQGTQGIWQLGLLAGTHRGYCWHLDLAPSSGPSTQAPAAVSEGSWWLTDLDLPVLEGYSITASRRPAATAWPTQGYKTLLPCVKAGLTLWASLYPRAPLQPLPQSPGGMVSLLSFFLCLNLFLSLPFSQEHSSIHFHRNPYFNLWFYETRPNKEY